MPIVAGVRLSREQVLAVAALLTRAGSDHTARLLLAAAMNPGQEFVALTTEDRESILDVLGRPPADLAELRGALFDELNWRRRHGTRPVEPAVRWV
jgi:uncharacterized protein (DUF1778 family)